MTHTTKMTWVLALVSALLTLPLVAQPRRGGGEPKYDTATELSLAGTIVEVMEVDGPGGRKGVHLIVEDGDGQREVCVGPVFYLEAQKITFAVDDGIEVVGSEVQKDSGKAVIAREIVRGQETITLRNERGIPRWSRGNRY